MTAPHDPKTDRSSEFREAQRERENLRNIFDSMEDGVYVTSPDCEIEYINPALKRQFGPIDGRKCHQYFHNRDQRCPWCKRPEVTSGKAVGWQWRSPENGRTYHLLDTPLRNPDGSVSKLGIFRDITDIKEAEESLRQLSHFPEENPNPVLRIAHDGALMYANAPARDWLATFGWPPDGPLPAEVRAVVTDALGQDHPVETEIDDPSRRTLWLSAVRPPGESYVNIYGRDVTARKETEEALALQQELLQRIFDHIPVLLVAWDPRLERFTLNRYAEEVLGWTTADANEKDLMTLVYPDEGYRAEVAAYMQSLEPGWREWIGTTRDGQRVPIDWANIRLSDDTMIGIGVDLRQRRQAEQSLRQSEQRLNRAQEIAHLGSWELDLAANRLTWSDEVYRIFGLAPQQFEATYDAFLAHVHPDDRDAVDAAYTDSVREGRDSYDIEHRVVRNDTGEIRYVQEKCQHVRDAAARVARSMGMVLDITEHIYAEQALRRSEERLRLAVEAASLISFEWDIQRNEVRRFASTDPTFATTPEEAPSTFEEVRQVVHPEDREQFTANVRAAMDRRDGQYENEFRIVRRDGTVAWLYERGCVEHDAQGRPTRLIGLSQDVTARKNAEEQIRASLREKEVLLKEIHHRVKNNMQVISSLVSLQAEGSRDAAMQAVLQDVTDRVRSMALVHEKLYQSADLAQVDFAEYGQSLLEYLWRARGTEAAGVRLQLDLAPVPLSVNAAVPCGLILNELASNALKHAFDDRPDAEVAVSLRRDPDGRVRLTVRDNGTGLPPGTDWRRSRSLGLRLVQMLTRQLRGTVEAVTGEGEGTEFHLAFEGGTH